MKRPLFRSIAILLVLVFLFPGCSKSASKDPSQEDSSMAGEPSLSQKAEPIEGRDRNGAERFIRRYIEAQNTADATLETTELRKMTASSCIVCMKWIRGNEKLRDAGGWQKLHYSIIGRPVATESSKKSAMDVIVNVRRGRILQKSDPGGKIESDPATKLSLAYTVQWTSSGWVVSDLVIA